MTVAVAVAVAVSLPGLDKPLQGSVRLCIVNQWCLRGPFAWGVQVFYYVSKLVWFVLQPSNLVAFTIAAGVLLDRLTDRVVLGRRLVLIGLLILLLGGFSPLANLLIFPLESRVARASIDDAASIRGIIVLGGAEDGRISLARGTLALNEAAERITDAVMLARRLPKALVVFSGGAGPIFRDERPGITSVAAFLQAAGVARARIKLEGASRNTYENALLTRKLLQPAAGQRWLLVTSAFHMPRALGCFRQLGFDVLPWPVDYRTKDAGDLLRPFDSIAKGMRRLDVAAKEWLGLVVYRLSGRIGAFFPGGT